MAAIPHSTSGEKPNRLPPPELDDAEYVSEVLRLQEGQTEEALDAMILREAESLGVPTTRPRPVPETASAASSTSQATASASRHGRNGSTATNETASTALTAYSTANDAVPPWSTVITSTTISSNSFLANPSSADASNPGAVAQKRSKSLSFSQYDKYLAKLDPSVSLTVSQPKFLETPPPETKRETAPSIFSAVTRKSYFSIKKNLNLKLRFSKKKSAAPTSEVTPCVCCREDFAKTESIQRLPCGHSYCSNCLRIMAKQASVDESKMPPRCCAQPIPGHIVKAVLANSKEEQQAFLKAVEQFATPWESRIFCPNKACGDFIPPRQRVDPKNPFSVACRRCRTRVCIMCKRDAHRIGQDCPEDYELEAVLKIGENAGWRRCYKCRTLVELTQGCTHMTCRCKAQFCYICGGVWDANVGCPNFCNGEEEMERRRAAEELRLAEERAEKAAAEAAALAEAIEREAAEQRTASNAELKALREQQKAEMARFLSFEKRMRWVLWNRHAQEKTLVAERYRELADKMRERHAKTVAHLEDRQIAAEMDLRATLEAMERSVRIRLKHMEAYCEGLGRTATNGGANDGTAPANSMPPRVVTERDLRELGQQYNVRDGMERLHAAKINVMRDRQQKQMEELLERQEAELARLDARRADELDAVDAAFNEDDDAATATFLARRERLSRRWEIQAEILRTKIELRDNLKLAPLPELRWPQEAIDVAAPLANDTARVVVGTSIVEDELDSQIAALDLHEKTALADRIPAITYSTVLVG